MEKDLKKETKFENKEKLKKLAKFENISNIKFIIQAIENKQVK